MKKIRIGIDVDNVILDFSKGFVDEFNRITGKQLNKSDLTKWDLEELVQEIYGNSIEDGLANRILRHRSLVVDMDYKESSRETLFRMNNHSKIEIVIITALHKELTHLREEWFKKEFPDLKYELHFEHNKSNVQYINPIDYLIDDGVHNLDELSKYIPKENCLCIEEPYNLNSGYNTFKTLKEAYEYILKKEKI